MLGAKAALRVHHENLSAEVEKPGELAEFIADGLSAPLSRGRARACADPSCRVDIVLVIVVLAPFPTEAIVSEGPDSID